MERASLHMPRPIPSSEKASIRSSRGKNVEEESDFQKARRAIDSVIRDNIELIAEPPDGVGADYVTGWFLAIETMAPAEFHGKDTQAYAVHSISADATASRDLTPWAAKGFLHHVLDNSDSYLHDYDHFDEDEE